MTHFISLVSRDFWPGIAALLESIETNSSLRLGDSRFTLICDLDTAPVEWLQRRAIEINLLPSSALPEIKVLAPQQQGKRMEVALQKCAVFALPPSFGKCTYIDADMLCIGSLHGLKDMPPLTFTAEFPLFTTALPRFCFEDPIFECNTGCFVFNPDMKIFRELEETYKSRHSERTLKGDQDIFNIWMRERQEKPRVIGAEWNFAKRYSHDVGNYWIKSNLSHIKFLHFVGAKPWTPNSEINTVRECRYRWMEEIWWDYFEKSGFAAHMKNPPRRSTAFIRQWVLPWSKPSIIKEHAVRARRLVKKMLHV